MHPQPVKSGDQNCLRPDGEPVGTSSRLEKSGIYANPRYAQASSNYQLILILIKYMMGEEH
jgi:hypothetical protein